MKLQCHWECLGEPLGNLLGRNPPKNSKNGDFELYFPPSPQKKSFVQVAATSLYFFWVTKWQNFMTKKDPSKLQCILLSIFIHQEKCEYIQKLDDKDLKVCKRWV
jgi:hypothetical protein